MRNNHCIWTFLLCFWFCIFDGASKNIEKDTSPSIEIECCIEKTGYVGEAIEYTVIMKSSVPNIADVRIIQAPEITGDAEWVKGLVTGKPREETIKGKKIYTWTVQRNFLIPQKEGKITISGAKYVAFIAVEKIVKDFFWGSRRVMDYEEIVLESKPISTKIENLPVKKRPADFTGCVGEFTIEGWFPPGTISLDRDAIVVFNISGFGSLKNLKLPNLASIFNKGCILKEIEQNEEISQKDGKLFSEVTLTCKFVPLKEDGEISPLVLSFFNPKKKEFEKVSSFTLHWDNNENSRPRKKIEAIDV